MYCFVAGHCNNTEVTEATTQVEASAICDKLYGQRQGMIGNDRCPKTKEVVLFACHSFLEIVQVWSILSHPIRV